MKKLLLSAIVSLSIYNFVQAQCTTTNGTGCVCKDGSTDCDLLPDIILANEPLEVGGNNGVIEYSQTGNGQENGRLRVSVSTPNIGHGPLTVRSSSIYLCGTDTFTTNPGTCPGGGSPRNLTFQRIYHKDGNTMTYTDRPAGSMTYHPTHQHMHVDDWGVYALRVRDTSIADPLQWQIIGTGAKLGFCLMDYGTCSYYSGHCVDSIGNVLLNDSFPNFALGGGNYNCDPNEQGISSGYADIYYQYLDGMFITIPPTTCNGEYYIVVQIDPHNYFLEEREDNNVIAIPYTLTRQLGRAEITSVNFTGTVCQGTPVTLTANPGSSYLWSSGDTTESITVTQPGSFTVRVNSNCGSFTSDTVNVAYINSSVNAVTDANGCQNIATMTASTTGTAHWFATDTGNIDLHTGSSFAPPVTGVYYVESHDTLFGVSGNVGPADNTTGLGGYYSNDQHMVFNVYKPLTLKSVKVYANSSKNRIIELRNSAGTVLQSDTVYIAQGTRTINLNFIIQPGNDYQLGWAVGSAPDLFRTSLMVNNYPYQINNLISITGNSSADLNRWYCYYNWAVEELPVTCISPRTPVNATITPAPLVNLSGLDTLYTIYDAAVTLSGSPAGGTFAGNGVSGNTFSPSTAGVGTYNVSYTYTDNGTGCPGIASLVVRVIDTVSAVRYVNDINLVTVSPNPNNGRFNVSLNSSASRKIDLAVTNVLGEKIWEEKGIQVNGNYMKNISLENTASGIYHLVVSSDKKQNTYKLVVE